MLHPIPGRRVRNAGADFGEQSFGVRAGPGGGPAGGWGSVSTCTLQVRLRRMRRDSGETRNASPPVANVAPPGSEGKLASRLTAPLTKQPCVLGVYSTFEEPIYAGDIYPYT